MIFEEARKQQFQILPVLSRLKQCLLDLDDWDINVGIQEENNEHEPQNFGPPARKFEIYI